MIDAAVAAFVRARAGQRCEYCRIHQSHVPLKHHIEHIRARKHGGSDDATNLALACERCNAFKGSDLTGIDDRTDVVVPLFHPRQQNWEDHFDLVAEWIVGRTPTGRATVAVLRMNEGQRLQLRAAFIGLGLDP